MNKLSLALVLSMFDLTNSFAYEVKKVPVKNTTELDRQPATEPAKITPIWKADRTNNFQLVTKIEDGENTCYVATKEGSVAVSIFCLK